MRLPLLPPALLLLAAAPAPAETFVLRDGSVVEGQILRTFRDEEGRTDRWEVRTLTGRRTLPAAEVREVRERRPGAPPYPWVHFENTFAFIDPGDAAENLRLGLWARERGMEAEALRALRRALAADPDDARVRTALGHLRVDGRWVAPAGREGVPEERGEAVAGGPPSPLEGVLGRVVARRRSENYHLESDWLDQAGLGRYLHTLEGVREATLAFLGEPPPVGNRREVLYLIGTREQYLRAVEALVAPDLEARADREEAMRSLRMYRQGFMAVLPGPTPGCVALRSSENEVEDLSFLAHFAVHGTWRPPTSGGARDPDWLREAVAYGVLNDLFPDDPTFCVATGYGREGRVAPTWRNTRTWPGTARALAASRKSLLFQDLAVLDLNSLTFDALVQAWSVLGVLRERDANGTRAFLRKVRRGGEQFEALKETLRMTPAEVDRLWRGEMLKRR